MDSPEMREFWRALERAARRVRGRRFFQTGLVAVYAMAGVLAVWLLVLFAVPAAGAWSGWVVGIVAAAVAAVVIIAWALPVPEAWASAEIDRSHGLPDAALSAMELQSEEIPAAWRVKQLDDTVSRIRGSTMRSERGPMLPLLSGAAGACVLAILVVLQSGPSPADAEALAAQEAFAAQAMEIEELFKDWEQAMEESPDPELQRLLEQLRPLRDKVASGEVTQKEMLLELSKAEERLASMQRQLAEASIEPFAAEMADALSRMGGMEALASALSERDFARAKEAADKLAEKFNDPSAQVPEGAKDASVRQQASALGDKLEQAGQQSMAQAMQGMASAGKKNDSKSMSQAMRNASMAMSQQQARDQQKKSLGLCRSQLGMCKQCMGDGESMCEGLSLMPKLAQAKGGKGAGSQIDPNRFGEETEGLQPGVQENLSGVADPSGESETMVESTAEAPRQQTAAVALANFEQYKRMSEAAIEDESLPLAHRATIRRYFESIRPGSQTDPTP
jgi:hypothetical protein